jgi:WXXGXW repeat (2 copies)
VPARGVAVSGPPPAPIAEAQPPGAPAPGTAWVAGYWHWTGMQYAWIPGHWENAPPGAAWTAPRYVKADGAYFYEAGRWRPASSGPKETRASANAIR